MSPGVLWALVNVLLVLGVSGVDTDEESVFVKEGDSVTLHTNIEANQQETMRWYFNDTLIAAIIGEKREVCSYDECKERFRDRLKLDHQTGSLTITNTRTTDSGEYKVQIIIISSSFSISRILTVLTVNAVPDSGLYSVAGAGIGVTVVLLIITAAAVFLYHRARRKNTQNNRDQGIKLKDVPRDQSMTPCIPPEVNTSCRDR